MKRKIKLLGLSSLTLILLAACGRSEVTASSTNGWDQIVYFFAKAIQWLSINGRIGVGIVLFTIIIRAIMMPLYNMQIKSGQKMQDLQPGTRCHASAQERKFGLFHSYAIQDMYKKREKVHALVPVVHNLLLSMPVLPMCSV